MSSQPVKDWPSLIITTVTTATISWWPHHHLVKHCTSCQHQVRPATADKVGTVACIVKETFCSPSKPHIFVNINQQTVSNPNKTKKQREREKKQIPVATEIVSTIQRVFKENNNVSNSALHWGIYLPTHNLRMWNIVGAWTGGGEKNRQGGKRNFYGLWCETPTPCQWM